MTKLSLSPFSAHEAETMTIQQKIERAIKGMEAILTDAMNDNIHGEERDGAWMVWLQHKQTILGVLSVLPVSEGRTHDDIRVGGCLPNTPNKAGQVEPPVLKPPSNSTEFGSGNQPSPQHSVSTVQERSAEVIDAQQLMDAQDDWSPHRGE